MDAMTITVDSSRKLDYLNYFPDILHEFDNLSGFRLTMLDVRFKRHTQGAAINPRNWGPIAVLSIIGAMFSLVLIGLAIYTSDGTAIVTISLISLANTFTGVACISATKDHTSMDSGSLYFKTPAKAKKHVDPSSPEDLILRNDKGAFILVRCDTSVSRNLYFNQEHCVYLVGLLLPRITICLGICTFMAGVILLANCTWKLQAATGIAYIALNIGYWMAAVLPARLSWDMSCYDVRILDMWEFETYTQALVRVIAETKTVAWARGTVMVPANKLWESWLDKAENYCKGNPWYSEGALGKLFEKGPKGGV
jgi:hypothetical protein